MGWSRVYYDNRFQLALPLILLIVYFGINLLFLTRFPFVHSDESWLGGLSRHMMVQNDAGVTEPFFDVYERYPHAVKVLYHGLQILFIKIFGYSVFSLRLMSLLFSCGTLIVFYKLTAVFFRGFTLRLLVTALLASDIQFLYASRFARQEIVILFLFLLGLYCFYRSFAGRSLLFDLFAGLTIGFAVGVHPNAFVIFLPVLFLYIFYFFRGSRKKWVNMLVFLGPIAAAAGTIIILSFRFDSEFVRHYFEYGSSYGVDASPWRKVVGMLHYYYKLFFRVGGTYYLPLIAPQLIVFGITFAGAFVMTAASTILRRIGKTGTVGYPADFLLITAGLHIGIAAIGKYNQTNIVFIFPVCILTAAALLRRTFSLRGRSKRGPAMAGFVFAVLLTLSIISSVLQVLPWVRKDYYRYYLANIAESVPPDAMVLANLNTDFYFRDGMLRDYRNLAFLDEAGTDFSGYIRSRNIEYIIYPEEMDFIYNTRPVWNIIYGNLWPYYEDMQRFLREECREIQSFSAPVYGMRIVRYIGADDWTVRIYRVLYNRTSSLRD